jgi:hypothetical protein
VSLRESEESQTSRFYKTSTLRFFIPIKNIGIQNDRECVTFRILKGPAAGGTASPAFYFCWWSDASIPIHTCGGARTGLVRAAMRPSVNGYGFFCLFYYRILPIITICSILPSLPMEGLVDLPHITFYIFESGFSVLISCFFRKIDINL